MKIKDVCEIKETLVTALKNEVSQGLQHLDTEEAFKVADIIKDLAETERNCYEACYYKTVIEAMDEKGEEDEDEGEERYGYRRGGRNYPMMRNYRMGYRPYIDQKPYVDAYLNDPEFHDKMRENQSKYGKAYDDYQEAKRHYSQSKNSSDKEEMTARANEHIANALATMREIWKDATPEQKRKMKADVTALAGEMT